MTIYLPDDLAAEVKAELGDSNVSGIAQQALRDELERARARKAAADKLDETGFVRVEVYDGSRERDVAFQGKKAGTDWDTGTTVYLTPKGSLAVVGEGGVATEELLRVYDDFKGFRVAFETGYCHSGYSFELVADVAKALGEKPPVEELDI